jgi:5-(aminomethyl)-3-furanmethanol phosphate kinase
MAKQAPAERLLIVGGGELADSIRKADKLHNLGEEMSHWLCVRTMAIHAEMLRAMLPESSWCASVRRLTEQPATPGLVIVDPWTFLHDEEPFMSPTPLPANWQVTSDSIAARLASLIKAAELALLKSALPNSGRSVDQAAEAGYFDCFFPQASRGLPLIRAVNLRDHEFAEQTWHANDENCVD